MKKEELIWMLNIILETMVELTTLINDKDVSDIKRLGNNLASCQQQLDSLLDKHNLRQRLADMDAYGWEQILFVLTDEDRLEKLFAKRFKIGQEVFIGYENIFDFGNVLEEDTVNVVILSAVYGRKKYLQEQVFDDKVKALNNKK